jgi:thiol-disulfide isomerase/thioredoxin
MRVGFLACSLCAACNAAAPPGQSAASSPAKPVLLKGEVPVAPFVANALAAAPSSKTVVYVGASWCEPCQRFHRALVAGELDARLAGVRFIEYDSDSTHEALAAAGYSSRLIPFFALPSADGRASSRHEEGSVKGDGAVANILPRLEALLR